MSSSFRFQKYNKALSTSLVFLFFVIRNQLRCLFPISTSCFILLGKSGLNLRKEKDFVSLIFYYIIIIYIFYYIYIFILLESYLYLSAKIFNTLCGICLFFAEIEDALAKSIFLITNKCLLWLYYFLLIADSF